MAIPKWITDTVGKTTEFPVKGYQVPNGPTINFDDPLYAELYDQYVTGQLDESTAAAVDEIEFLRDVTNQATAKLISAMRNKTAADDKKPEAPKKEEKPEAKEAPEEKTPKMEKPDKNEEAPPKELGKVDTGRNGGNLPEPSVSKWNESRYNERLDTWQAIVTERSVRNFHTEEEGLEYLKDA